MINVHKVALISSLSCRTAEHSVKFNIAISNLPIHFSIKSKFTSGNNYATKSGVPIPFHVMIHFRPHTNLCIIHTGNF